MRICDGNMMVRAYIGGRKTIGGTSHDEVCYESSECPVCAVREEADSYQRIIEELQKIIKGLEAE